MNLHSRLISYEKINCVFWYILNDVILKLTADSRVLFQSKQISADDSEMYSIKRHWQTDNCERDLEQIKMVFLSSESIWTKPILSKRDFSCQRLPPLSCKCNFLIKSTFSTTDKTDKQKGRWRNGFIITDIRISR